MIPDGLAWGLAVIMALALASALVARFVRPGTIDRLPPAHVAAAAIVGVAAWEAVVDFPGLLVPVFSISSGLGTFVLTSTYVFTVAEAAFIAGSVLAVVAILRRRVWGAVLGIGVSVARAAFAVLALTSTLATIGSSMPPDQTALFVATIGLRAMPAVAAIVLLAWPLIRPGPAGLRSTPLDADGITDLDPTIGVDDWPPAERDLQPSQRSIEA